MLGDMNRSLTATLAAATAAAALASLPAGALAHGTRAVPEGNAGTARFPVSLSAPSGLPTTVSFATTDGTAHAGSDYVARSGTVTFAPGETVEQVSVPVVDDAVHEDTEGFALSLSSPVGATLGTAQGQATI